MFGSFDISGSGLTAQRTRLDTVASNLANISTTRDANGNVNPYRRLYPVFEAQPNGDGKGGVRVSKIEQDMSPLQQRYEPWNPDRNSQGYVSYPNVELSTEYINALEATRAYEANVTAIETTKSMLSATMRILA